MIGLIVTGHGHFATGLKSALALLGGEPSDFVAVDFPDGDTTEDLAAKLTAALEELAGCEGVLVCCDLLGGSRRRPRHRWYQSAASCRDASHARRL